MSQRRPASRPAPATAPAVSQAPAAPPTWLRWVILALAALALMAMFSDEMGDADTWIHLRTGQWMWENHKLPIPDPFAWTTYLGKPVYPSEAATRDLNLKHEWLGQVIVYLVYATAGVPGMVLFRALCVSGFCAIVGWVVYRRTREFYPAIAAAFLAATLARYIAVDRPYVITYLLLALTLAILERRRWLWLLPPIFVFWANVHGGFFMGWVLLGAYCGEALIQRLRRQPPADERTLWAVSIVSILASGLNPAFFGVIPGMFAYRQSFMQNTLREWHPPALFGLSWFSALLLGAAAVMLWARARVRPADWLMYLVFAILSLMALRNIIFIGLIAPVVIFSYLPSYQRLIKPAAEYAVALLLGIGIFAKVASGSAFQLHAADWKFPRGAVRFLHDHNISAPMFNLYEWGGYLMWAAWPQEKTFVDGRALNESVFRDYLRIGLNFRDAQELLDKYGVQVILLEGFEYSRGTVYMLGPALSDPAQTRWKLVFQDKAAMLFMRQPPPGVQPLDPREVFASLEAQCTEYVQHVPQQPRCARGLGDLYARLGHLDSSRQWLEFYMSRNTDPDPDIDRLYQQIRSGTFHAPAQR
jgi:hypothetical protein